MANLSGWTPEQIALVLGAASAGIATVIGAISVAAVKVITALKGVSEKIQEQTDRLTEHDLRAEMRTDRLQDSIKSKNGECE